MKILFTRSNNPVDWLIHLATGEDCAHMALLFEAEHGTGVVFESNLLGCHPAFFSTWMGTTRTIVHELNVVLSSAQEDEIWDKWVTTFDGKGYDVAGAIFLGLCKVRKRIFGTPLPARNRWAKRQRYFCDEIYQIFSGIPGFTPIEFRANGMSSPHDVWVAISKVVSNG